MDADEFVDRFKHELFGVVVDAMVVHRTGPELSQWIKIHFTKIEQKLAEMHEALSAEMKARKPAQPGR